MLSTPKVATGVDGLDQMLDGGFPQGRISLIIGGPGCGKSVLCSQFLYHGASSLNEKAVYISLDETRNHYLIEMSAFGWDFENLENEGKFSFVDANSVRLIPQDSQVGRLQVGGKELGLINLIDMITSAVEKSDAKRVVLDSVSGLIFRFPKIDEGRMAILDIIEALDSTEATCLLTSELISSERSREIQAEEYLAHGVVALQILSSGDRAIQISKMRGGRVDTHPRPYMIKDNGFEVYASENIIST
jgi:KaiC/GvpD/RAD55 family RecA-like ATPase